MEGEALGRRVGGLREALRARMGLGRLSGSRDTRRLQRQPELQRARSGGRGC